MAKRRMDTQVVAPRIDQAVADGRAQVLPIFPPQNERSSLGRKPNMMVLLEPLRLRLPPVRDSDRGRYQRSTGRRWDNRTTIPRCLLNARWIKVTDHAPDLEELKVMTPSQLKLEGIFSSHQGMQRRIYEVVEDVSHGLRQCLHVKEDYYPEIESLAATLTQITDRFAQSQTGLVAVTDVELRKLNANWTQANGRLTDIGQILQDRVTREVSLALVARIAAAQLFARHASLNTFTEGFKKAPRGNNAARELYLNSLSRELAAYSAPEVRKQCLRARFLIGQAALELGEPQRAIARLVVATRSIAEAANNLAQWATTLEERKTGTETETTTGRTSSLRNLVSLT